MIRLSKPLFSKSLNKKINKILNSGNLINGFYTNRFEKELNLYFKTNNCIAVSSGTAALHLALIALGISKDNEVIIPAFSYIATANVVENVGAKPVFVDIDIENLCIDINKIEKKINKKTKAIIVVHEFGNICNINQLLKICKKYKIKLIEDAACSFGSKFNNKLSGLFGDISCFSLHPRKIITSSEGGIIIAKSKKDYNFMKSYKNHGLSNKNKDFIYSGLNYRISELHSALALDQLSTISKNIKNRRKIAEYYNRNFRNNKNIMITNEKSEIHCNYQSYHIILKNNLLRNKLKNYLYKNNIETNIGAQFMPKEKYYKKKYNLQSKYFPNAYKANMSGLVLPIGDHISTKQAKIICEKIKNFF